MSATATQTATNGESSPASSPYTWAQGPFPLITTPVYRTGATDPFTFVASEMAIVHNCVLRALNSIYHQAPHVPASEYKNFVRYCLATYEGLDVHHTGEETFIFPELERRTGEKGVMETNVQQHEAFHHAFEAWGDYLKELISSKKESEFDPKKCIEMMDAYVEPLGKHMADEIPTILSLERFGDKVDMMDLWKLASEHAVGGMSKTTQLPIYLFNHDVTHEGGIHTSFPPVPAPVKFALMQVFGRWNSAWWKFSTCGFDGQPRELAYLGKAPR